MIFFCNKKKTSKLHYAKYLPHHFGTRLIFASQLIGPVQLINAVGQRLLILPLPTEFSIKRVDRGMKKCPLCFVAFLLWANITLNSSRLNEGPLLLACSRHKILCSYSWPFYTIRSVGNPQFHTTVLKMSTAS